MDAAYIPTTTAITNKINNSSTTKLTGVVYNYQMESVSGITGKYFGATNGTQSGLVTVSDGYLSMLMSSAISERAGDSGGTIYLTNTSQNRLIGIVKGQSGNTMINGIPWTSIASAYYSCTGLILSPKIN